MGVRPIATAVGRAAALLFAAVAFSGFVAAAPTVTLRQVATGFSLPVEVSHPGDGTGRLFVVEQGGRIRILQGGAILSPAFLDISTGGIITAGGERGLLGLAFHPNYAANRAFYVYYTNASGNLVVARILRNAANPSLADPASRVELLEIPHPGEANHNGGKIAFGPDGYLYIGTGDGGGGGDPFRTGQDLNSGRGKILRIAVDGGAGYTIPPSNPFASSTCAPATEFCREVFHYGLRNPWKFSFDRATGDLFVGDVGQGAWEEVDYVPAGSAGGVNFGWGIFEGNACYNDTYFGPAGTCAGLANHTRPVVTYDHGASGGFSITGGYRYRGRKSAPLRGYYIYGDFGSKRIWAVQPNAGGTWAPEVLLAPSASLSGISSFAQDEAGELYVVDLGNGKLWAIDGPGPAVQVRSDLNADARSDLLFRNSATGQVYRLLMDGLAIVNGAFAYTEPDTTWKVVADGDFNGDGVTDLLYRNDTTGAVHLLTFGASGFPNGGATIYSEPNAAWSIVQAPDIDGDGKSDLVWWNSLTGQVYVMLMDGTRIVAQGFLYAEPNTDWKIVASGDFAGNGKANQLLWRNGSTGRLYLMTIAVAGGAFTPSGAFIYMEPNTAWKIAGAADFDGDGKTDILYRNDATGQVFMLLMNGGSVAGGGLVYTEPNLAWKIVAHGDYNGDGKADLLWRNESTGQVFMMLMNGLGIASQAMVYVEPNTAWKLLGPWEYGRQ